MTTLNGHTIRTEQTATDVPEPSARANIERTCAGVIKTERVDMRMSAAGVIFANRDVAIERGGARDIVATGDVRMTRAGAGLVLAGGGATFRQSGAGTVFSLGDVSIEQGGACSLAARNATVGRGGVVLLALTPRLQVADGGRVLSGPFAILAGVIGAGLAIAVSRFIRFRRRE